MGNEAIVAGTLTPGQLRWRHTAVHPGVYVPKNAEQTLFTRTVAAWLWTGRRGIVAGRAVRRCTVRGGSTTRHRSK